MSFHLNIEFYFMHALISLGFIFIMCKTTYFYIIAINYDTSFGKVDLWMTFFIWPPYWLFFFVSTLTIIKTYLVCHFKHCIAHNTFIDFPHCVVWDWKFSGVNNYLTLAFLLSRRLPSIVCASKAKVLNQEKDKICKYWCNT